jgi:hypothetical protein
MSTIVNLFSGPGSGKSTSAAYLYAALKARGENCELVREYVKDWAWENRRIGPYDQLYFMGKQIRKETLLLNKVEFIITDSPVELSAFYASKYAPIAIQGAVNGAVEGYLAQLDADGHRVVNLRLTRSKPYNGEGRYQTEEEAVALDNEIQTFFWKRGVFMAAVATDFHFLDQIADSLIFSKP